MDVWIRSLAEHPGHCQRCTGALISRCGLVGYADEKMLCQRCAFKLSPPVGFALEVLERVADAIGVTWPSQRAHREQLGRFFQLLDIARELGPLRPVSERLMIAVEALRLLQRVAKGRIERLLHRRGKRRQRIRNGTGVT